MADLTIRGAGIFGLSIAWEALQRGARVRVVDPNGPGAGSSGGVVGALQPHTPDNWNAKKQFQLESLIKARSFWPDVAEASGLNPGYARAGRLQPIQRDRDIALAQSRTAAAADRWGTHASWNVISADDAPNWRPHSPTGLYIHDTLSALLDPAAACKSLAIAIRARGGDILKTAPDTSAPTIWATGWQGLLDLSKETGIEQGNGVKGQAARLDFNAIGAPQIFADGLHIIPHENGTVGIGSTSERVFDDPTSTDAQLDEVIARAKSLMPVLENAPVLERWAGVRPRASSRAPLLGPWPDRPNHFIANGGFKIGFGMAPKIAEIMCDLVLDQQNNIPQEFSTRTIDPS